MKNFLFYFLTYILTITAVAFVTVKIDSITSTDGASKSEPVIFVPETVGDKLITNIVTMGGAEIKIDAEIAKSDDLAVQSLNDIESKSHIVIGFDGVLNLSDFENIKIDGVLKIESTSKTFNLKIILVDNVLYLSYGDLNVKLKVKSIEDVLSAISYFGVDLNIDVSSFGLDEITNALDNIEEIKLEDETILLKIKLFDEYEINAYCDENYNLNKVEASLFISNTLIDLSASIKKSDNIIIKNPDVGTIGLSDEVPAYFDISGAGQMLEKIGKTINTSEDKNILAFSMDNLTFSFGNVNIHLNGNVAFDVSTVDLFKDFDLNKINLYVVATLSIDGYANDIDFILHIKDGVIYLSCDEVDLCITVDKVLSLVDIISETISHDKFNIYSIIFGNFDFFKGVLLNKLSKNFNLDKILDSIKFLEINNDSGKIIIDGSLFKSAEDINITLDFNDQLMSFNIETFIVKKLSIFGKLLLESKFEIAPIQSEKYTCIDEIVEFARGLIDFEEQYNAREEFAVNFSTSLSTEKINYYKGTVESQIQKEYVITNGTMGFDWWFKFDKKFYLTATIQEKTTTIPYLNGTKNLNAKTEQVITHYVEIIFTDGVLYFTFDNLKYRLKDFNVINIYKNISELIEYFDSDIAGIGEIVSNTGLINKIKPSIIKELNFQQDQFTGVFDLSKFNLNRDKNAYINAKLEDDGVRVTLNNIVLGDFSIGQTEIKTSDELFMPEVNSVEFTPLIGVGSLTEALANSLLTKNYDISGTINLKLTIMDFINIDWDLPIEFNVNLEDNTKEFEFIISNIPVIAGVNDDAPYEFGNTVSGLSCAKDRTFKIYYKDQMIIINRFEKIPVFLSEDRTYEKTQMIHVESFLQDPLYYIFSYGFGFKSSVMDKIRGNTGEGTSSGGNSDLQTSLNKIKNIISSEMKSGVLNININLNNVLGELFSNLEIKVSFEDVSNKKVIKSITFNTDVKPIKNIVINFKSSDISYQIKQGDTSKVFENYKYKEGEVWYAINNEWKRDTVKQSTIYFVSNCGQNVDAITTNLGNNVTLPILDNYYSFTEEKRITHVFVGWCATYNFKDNIINNMVVRKDITLFAKWNEIAENYVFINFETNADYYLDSLKVVGGYEFDLPEIKKLVVEKNEEGRITKQFIGWYIDEELTIPFTNNYAPKFNLTLYAKWKTVELEKAYKLFIYENGELIDTKYFVGGEQIELIGRKYQNTTKYYTDDQYRLQISLNKMPYSDLSVYIRNYYNFTYKSEFGNVIDKTEQILQGSRINITQQKSYYNDDYTKTKREEYTFNGFIVNGVLYQTLENYVMGNCDVEIIASWTCNVRKYITISFNVDFVKPAAWIQNSFAVKTKCISAPRKIESITVLEGTTVDVTPYIYNTSCTYEYSAIGISKQYKFKVKCWNAVQGEQLSYNDTVIGPTTKPYEDSLIIVATEDIVLYPVWYCVE